MSKDPFELTTEDLVLEEPPRSKLPTAQTRSSISVTPASGSSAKPAPERPRFVPSALSRPIKEKSRTQSQEKPQESATGMVAKAAAFFEEALEAQRAGDAAAAIRHVKMAMTFNPKEPRYQELLSKLER